MANPTTYFGWVMPNSADLVTDLPADFNVFGQGVDTSMSQLLGGTTGQVLSKTSGTNMAFTWVTPTDQTPLTTKGDLFTFSTVDARLGVGTDSQILVADSTASTGLKWATPATSGVTLIQRTSFSNVAGTSTTFDGVFSSTYSNYTIMIEYMFAATTTDDLQMQGIYSGTTETTQYYGSSLLSPVTGATLTITGTNNASQFTIASQTGSTNGRTSGFFVYNDMGGGQFFNVNGQIMDSGNLNAPSFFGGGTVTARTYTGFLLKSSSSNITGTVSVYGWAKS